MKEPLLSVRIWVDYPGKPGAISDVGFDVARGEALGLAGESGSGKSTIALAILRLLQWRGGRVRGEIRFDGRDLLRMNESQLRRLRGKEMSLVMQSPASALNPALRLETHLHEAWRLHSQTPWRDSRPQIQSLLHRMGLPSDDGFLRRYPGQVSVGQAQRVVIAMAVMHRPKLIVADEPTSALDPGSRREILALLRSLKQEHGAALFYISHDLDSIRELCERDLVLDAGRLNPLPQRGLDPLLHVGAEPLDEPGDILGH
jgi:ABC-type glutathione transport system ATPase component